MSNSFKVLRYLVPLKVICFENASGIKYMEFHMKVKEVRERIFLTRKLFSEVFSLPNLEERELKLDLVGPLWVQLHKTNITLFLEL